MLAHMTNRIVIIPGMPRTGTSYLYHVLQKHPNLFLPHRKELSFFCSNYNKGSAWYENFFENIQPQEYGLDVSPVYFLLPESMQRIKEYNPDIKVILCIRSPSDWILSWYSQLLSHELHMPPFKEFIKAHEFKPSIGLKFQVNLQNNFISKNISEYAETFGSNALIYHYDFFKSNPLLVLQAIERFLALPEYFTKDNTKNLIINAGNRKNIWLLSYLLSRETTVRLLEFAIPRKKLQQIRNNFDRGSTPNKGRNPNVYTEENIQLAKKVFANDDAFVDSFFSPNLIKLGNGKSYIDSQF